MTRIFLFGSRRCPQLATAVRSELERLVEQGCEFLVGDANGADKAFQRWLASRHHERVRVFFVGSRPRNNLGHWLARRVETSARPGTFDFYAAKDREMSRQADEGLCIWDEESRGTRRNIVDLSARAKKVLVYSTKRRAFLRPEDTEALGSSTETGPERAEQLALPWR